MKDATRAVMAGRPVPPGPERQHGTDPSVAPEARRLAEAVAALEGGYRAELAGSGSAALAATLFSLLSPGDHLLLSHGASPAARRLCDGLLARYGVSVTGFDAAIGPGVADLIRPDTAALFLAAPGEGEADLPDTPAIAAAADAAGVWTILDNSWATPIGFKPFEYGVDVSIQDASRHLGGRGDLRLGVATATRTAYPKLRRGWRALDEGVSAETAERALIGLETLPLRMMRHGAGSLAVASWLRGREEVLRVRHPALPGDPSHDLWLRDFQGAGGRFVAWLDPTFADDTGVERMLGGLRVFSQGGPHGGPNGASWGGARSVVSLLPDAGEPSPGPAPSGQRARGWGIAIHVGLEEPDDLIADLAAGLQRLRPA